MNGGGRRKKEVFYHLDADTEGKKFTSLKLIRKIVHGLFLPPCGKLVDVG